jgi:hypothetical protein
VDGIKICPKKIRLEGADQILLAQNRVDRQDFVHTAMNLWVLLKGGESDDYLRNYELLKKDPPPWPYL